MNPVSAFNTEEKQFVMYSNGTPTWYPVQFHVFFFFLWHFKETGAFFVGNVCVCVAIHCAGSRVNLSFSVRSHCSGS